MSERTKCGKCGFDNPANLKFCGNCGAKLSTAIEAPRFEGLALLHITGSLYLLLSIIFNSLVRSSMVFTIPYLASGLLGLYAGYEYYKAKTSRYLKMISAIAIAIGFVSTTALFITGLEVRGLIGPAWIIFLINAWTLWRERVAL